MTTRVLLVCHAATSATRRAAFPDDERQGVGPSALPPAGRRGRESTEGGPLPMAERVDLALAGPGTPCRQTAADLGLKPTIEQRLRECDYGRWRGHTLAELTEAEPDAVQQWLTDPASAPHGGESTLDLIARVADWLDKLPTNHNRIAAVTHPSVIKAAIIHAIRATPESFWRIDIRPLSRTVLSGTANSWRLRALG